MKNAPANDLFRENYVVEIDGIAKFEYRVFVKALSAALQLKHDFPKCGVRLRDVDEHNTVTKALTYVTLR